MRDNTKLGAFELADEAAIKRLEERVLMGRQSGINEDMIRRVRRDRGNFCNIYKNIADNWYFLYNSKDSFFGGEDV